MKEPKDSLKEDIAHYWRYSRSFYQIIISLSVHLNARKLLSVQGLVYWWLLHGHGLFQGHKLFYGHWLLHGHRLLHGVAGLWCSLWWQTNCNGILVIIESTVKHYKSSYLLNIWPNVFLKLQANSLQSDLEVLFLLMIMVYLLFQFTPAR